ncbi:hypothetical protein GCM10027280_33650 [Micromonospora polyrhachis]
MRVACLIVECTKELLAAGQHPDIASVDTHSDPGTQMNPYGLKVTMRDGSAVYLKFTRTSSPSGDDVRTGEHIPYPDYLVPEGVRTCHQTVGAAGTCR